MIEMKRRMVTLMGLPHVKRKKVRAVSVWSVTDAIRCLKDGAKAITAAGDEGALNIWRDDAGNYRAEFMRRMVTLDRKLSPYRADMLRWLKIWWPQMRR